jgi:hypothetical protein
MMRGDGGRDEHCDATCCIHLDGDAAQQTAGPATAARLHIACACACAVLSSQRATMTSRQ